MSDDRRKNAPTGQFPRVPEGTPRAVPPAGSAAIRTAQPAVQSEARKLTPRDPRAQVVVPVRYRYESIIDFHETQSANISKTGMFVVTSEVVPQYTIVEFEVSLADGFLLMKGKAEVARVSTTPPRGLGLRFVQLDDTSIKLITRIVEVNSQEGKKPTVSMDFAPESPVGQSRSFQAPDPGSGLRRRHLEGAGPVHPAEHGHRQLLRLQPAAEHPPGRVRGPGREGGAAGHPVHGVHHHARR